MSEPNEIIRGMTDEEYFAVDRLSKHDTDLFDKNPHAFFLRKDLPPPEPTEAMRIGSALHMKILRPDLFERSYAVIPESFKVCRGKEWEAYKAEHEGLELIKIGQFQRIQGMAAALAQTEEVRGVFESAPLSDREVALFSEFNGIPVKSKVDMISGLADTLIDVKTASNASPEAFMRQAAELSYDVQAAFYIRNAENNGLRVDSFAFYVVETEFPYTTGIYTFSRTSDFVAAGELELSRRLKNYADVVNAEEDVLKSGWSAQDLPLPPWSKHLINLKEARKQK